MLFGCDYDARSAGPATEWWRLRNVVLTSLLLAHICDAVDRLQRALPASMLLSETRLISFPAGCAALCRDRLRELDRLRDREAAIERERQRQVKLDVVANDDTDDELPMWQRRPYSSR